MVPLLDVPVARWDLSRQQLETTTAQEKEREHAPLFELKFDATALKQSTSDLPLSSSL